VDLQVGKFINRLSDYFFVLSRYVAHQLKEEEVVYIPVKKS